MIECPVCLNQNEEKSLFCAECGQRFVNPNLASGSAGAKLSNVALSSGRRNAPTPIGLSALNPDGSLLQPPDKESTPKRPSIKLHSPILDGSGTRDSYPSADLESDDTETSPSAHHGLHSPLLDKEGNSKGFTSRPKDSGIHFPHRNSAELADGHNVAPQARLERSSRTLRSPLLGVGEGSGYDFEPDDYQPEIEEVDDPNVLRSPLLASKLPLAASADQVFRAKEPETVVPLPAPSSASGKYQASPIPSRVYSEGVRHEQRAGASDRDNEESSREERVSAYFSRKTTEGAESEGQDALRKFAGFMLVPLILAVSAKTWYLVASGGQIFSSLPFLGDQLGQLVVMIILIAYILTITSSQSR